MSKEREGGGRGEEGCLFFQKGIRKGNFSFARAEKMKFIWSIHNELCGKKQSINCETKKRKERKREKERGKKKDVSLFRKAGKKQ